MIKKEQVEKMVNIIMVGCNGKMGRVITNIVNDDAEATIVAGVDVFDDGHNTYPVYKSIELVQEDADVIIDFSNPASLDSILEYSIRTQVSAVLCSTGYSKEEIAKIDEAATKVAILRSGNMSLGINTMAKVMKAVTKVLTDAGFDVEIVEKHHNQKIDAPSGTALMLADAVNEQLNNEYEYCYDRSQIREKRPQKQIGISAVRGGSIVGEHEIIFAGTDEVLEFKHTAYSKAIFAKGAVQAAKFLKGQNVGMYSMKDVIG